MMVANLVRQPGFHDYLLAQNYHQPLLLRQSQPVEQVLSVQLVPFDSTRKLLLSRDITQLDRVQTVHRDFVANVSHELRTPLTRMRLNLEMLDGELQTLSSQKRKTDMTRDLIELNQMIESVLVSSRLDAQEKLETEQAVDLLALSHEEASHYDDVRVSGDAAMVRGDAALLRRLLRNLLDNAEKYGAAPIDVRVIEKHNTIEWHVSDSGAGVNVAEPNELFKPFVRASNQHGNQGTGLGLGMVKKIAELHGATAQVVSKSGEPMHVVVVFAAGLPA